MSQVSVKNGFSLGPGDPTPIMCEGALTTASFGTILCVTSTPDRRTTMLVEGQRLFLAQGYASTSVDAICEASQVTKGAFFHHFPTKDDFGSAVVSFTWQPVADHYEEHRSDSEPGVRLADHITFMATWVADSGRLIPSMAQQLGASNPEIRDQIAGYFAAWMAELETLLGAAVAATDSPADIGAIKEFIIATTEGIPIATSQFGPQAQDNATKRLVEAVLGEVGLNV